MGKNAILAALLLSGCVTTSGTNGSGVGTIDVNANCKVIATDGKPFIRPSRKVPGFYVYAHGSDCPRTLPNSDVRLFKVLTLAAGDGYVKFTSKGRHGIDKIIIRRNTDKYAKSKYKIIFIAGNSNRSPE